MTQYARVVAGQVFELFTPPDGASLTDCFHAEVAAQFVAVPAGDPTPQQGWTYDGTTFAAPVVPPPSVAQQAAAMLAAGIQIASTGTPALNGTYACDPTTYQRIGGIVAAIAGGLGLPGGGSTFNWPDTAGVPHEFTATAFTDFARAVMNFEYALNAVIAANAGTLPALPVAIP